VVNYNIYIFILFLIFLSFIFYKITILLKTKLEQIYSKYRIESIAEKLKFDILEGNPKYNIYISKNFKRPKDTKILLKGNHNNIEIILSYIRKVSRDLFELSKNYEYSFDCRIVAKSPNRFNPFIIISKKIKYPGNEFKLKKSRIKKIDKSVFIFTDNSEFAKHLGELTIPFLSLKKSGINIVGDGENISYIINEFSLPSITIIEHAKQIVLGLSKMASKINKY
jgi:hypothetical protein